MPPAVVSESAAAKAFEQLGFEFVFQLADLRADGRLRAIAGLRSLGKALQTDDFEECMKLVEVHPMP